MVRAFALTLAMGVSVSALADSSATHDVTMTGWFADAQCAAPRVAKGVVGPNNPECVARCLDKGVTPVFVSEQAKAMFEVKDYPSVKAELTYYVEVTGTVDETAKTIAVKSVKRLGDAALMCALPAKTSRPKK